MAPIEWKDSAAKEQLKQDLLDGTIPLDSSEMGPRAVYELENRPEFRKFVYEKFRTNLNSLRKSIREKRDGAASDSVALARDLRLKPRPTKNHRGEPRWEGSTAQKLMRDDVASGLQLQGRKPTVEDLYHKRPEYQDFGRRMIRKHIHQEEDAIKFRNYLDRSKAEKEAERQAKRAKEMDG